SSIASSSALCAFGVARLISSASTTCENSGPLWNSKRPVSLLKTETPMTSAGSRSLVNCTRWYSRPSAFASACASVVLPTPGRSSISRWPRASRHATDSRSCTVLPTMMRSSASMTRSICAAASLSIRAGRNDGVDMPLMFAQRAAAQRDRVEKRCLTPIFAKKVSDTIFPLLELGEELDLALEARRALLELGDPLALLRDDVGRRVRDERRVVELAAALLEVRARALELLAEPLALGADIDQPRERHEDLHVAEEGGRGAAHGRRGLDLRDLGEHREPLEVAAVPCDALAIGRARAGELHGEPVRGADVHLAADLPDADDEALEPLHLLFGLVVRGIVAGSGQPLEHHGLAVRAGRRGELQPQLLGHERDQRMQQLQERIERLRERRTRRRDLARVGVVRLKARFRELEVPAAELVPREVVKRLRREVEAVRCDGLVRGAARAAEPRADPAVRDRRRALAGRHAFREVIQHEPRRVPQLVAEAVIAVDAAEIEANVAPCRRERR